VLGWMPVKTPGNMVSRNCERRKATFPWITDGIGRPVRYQALPVRRLACRCSRGRVHGGRGDTLEYK
jgi:hypothetical protein